MDAEVSFPLHKRPALLYAMNKIILVLAILYYFFQIYFNIMKPSVPWTLYRLVVNETSVMQRNSTA